MNYVHNIYRGLPAAGVLFRPAASGTCEDRIVISPQPLPDTPAFQAALQNTDPSGFLRAALQHPQSASVHCIPDVVPGVRLLLIHENIEASLSGNLPDKADLAAVPDIVDGQTGHPRLAYPPATPVQHVLVIGAGIAGAATAYALARRGTAVTIADKSDIAAAASGNFRGLLYAKVSPHPTLQTQLLTTGYLFSRQLLARAAGCPDIADFCGVLHLHGNTAERQRHEQLAAQAGPGGIFRNMTPGAASAAAGVPVPEGGLWWPFGASLSPSAWAKNLLKHPLITVRTRTEITNLHHNGGLWQAEIYSRDTGKKSVIEASHSVICAGTDSADFLPTADMPFRPIRGQTSVAEMTDHIPQCALSGSSYVCPPHDNLMCFGATFAHDETDTALRTEDDTANLAALRRLNTAIGSTFGIDDLQARHAHAGLRCDVFDHLPVAGPVGNHPLMSNIYAKLALDKNYRINTPCPYQPNLYINTAHGSRGLTTAPLCAEAVASAILGLPLPFGRELRDALHPNRLLLRDIIRSSAAIRT